MDTPATLIEEAAALVGSQAVLAGAMGVSPQAVQKWKQSRIPSSRVLALEKISNISRQRLRPDLYPGKPGP